VDVELPACTDPLNPSQPVYQLNDSCSIASRQVSSHCRHFARVAHVSCMLAHQFSQKQCREQTAQWTNCLLLQVCRVNPGEKGKYIKIILSLLQSTSSAVVYECAVTLVSLSQAPTAIRAAANCYCQLLVSQSDNNVKLIVLDRLQVSHSHSLPKTARNQKLRKLLTAKERWCWQPVWH